MADGEIRQYNVGGSGFIGGKHEHYHVDGYVDAQRAAIEAARNGDYVGVRVIEADPAELGVHRSIAGPNAVLESQLTELVTRVTDRSLRQRLAPISHATDGATFILITGPSCAGKTRTLFEAVRAVLPLWRIIAPRNASELLRLLARGVPRQTVVWLDEIQDRLPMSGAGPAAAEALDELVLSRSEAWGPILVVGTLWPENLAFMRQRPSAADASAGAGAVSRLIGRAITYTVDETFSGAELRAAENSSDLRVRLAAQAAVSTYSSSIGARVTQVLAGGAPLMDRVIPPEGRYVDDAFSPAARAVIFAACDLRRLGADNPVPKATVVRAARGYLEVERPDDDGWIAEGLEEATREARLTSVTMGRNDLDIYRRGIPALSAALSGHLIVHDYLVQSLSLHRYYVPPTDELWSSVVDAPDSLDSDAAMRLAKSAIYRGRFSIAVQLLCRCANRDREILRLERYMRSAGTTPRFKEKASIENAQTLARIWAHENATDPNRRIGLGVGEDRATGIMADPRDSRMWSGHLAELALDGEEEELLRIARTDATARGVLVSLCGRRGDLDRLKLFARAGWAVATEVLLQSDAAVPGPRELDWNGDVVAWPDASC